MPPHYMHVLSFKGIFIFGRHMSHKVTFAPYLNNETVSKKIHETLPVYFNLSVTVN